MKGLSGDTAKLRRILRIDSRRSTSGVRAGRKRSRRRQSDTAALATSPLAHPVQTVLHNAFCFLWQLPRILN